MKEQFNTFKKLSFAITLMLAITLVGCKSKKVSVYDSSGTLKSKSHNEVLNDILIHELDYKTITTKGKVSFNGKEMTAIFKLVKNEIIQASVRPILGIEAMRMDIYPEKIIIIDRLGSRYVEIALDDTEVSSLSAFNFYNLQALFTNKLFLAGNSQVEKTDYDSFAIKTADNNFILETKDNNNILYNFTVDPSDRIVATNIAYPQKEMAIIWSYSDFVEDGKYIYPTTMKADVKVKKKTYKVGISYSDLEVNTDLKVDKSVLSRYKRIELADLVNSYLKLK